ncbi:MAG: hypothetical protein HQL47_12035, partial [Gammaproteobacteria bacterium]|nr:hypothetical protein [Gammaproteobacteria bacterium]
MENLLIHLRIGEKIGLGFGLVGLLFLGVIWQYQDTLTRSLGDYRHLVEVQSAQKDLLLGLENHLLSAHQAETAYQLKRDAELARRVHEQLEQARQLAIRLAERDPEAQAMSEQFVQNLDDYAKQFGLVEAAWQRQGVDENAGLQGSFRQAVHDLQEMAAHFNADALYLNLMQIRRSEKDLGLRREAQYQQRVHELISGFEVGVRESQLLDETKKQLLLEIASYRSEFDSYAQRVLEGGELEGGKGAFRDAAHRIEALLSAQYVPNLERDLLQLRRHEKDYLLRQEDKYVQLALGQINRVQERIQASAVNAAERERFLSLLQRYQADFLALVEQNRLIAEQSTQMLSLASQVRGLVKREVAEANRASAQRVERISREVEDRSRWMNGLLLLAVALGVIFAIGISSRIVKPMARMTAVLERLTYTELVRPLRYLEGGRDET